MAQIFISPECKLEQLKHLFIELTAKNCNQHCKQCYIDFPFNKNVKDFIHIDKIKEALQDTKDESLECIYFVGAEPMTHPDFNSILRLSLTRTNVCIHTNATLLNEKKIRFLKKVENESNYQIIFKLSFASYDEFKNDSVRFRGAFRQNIYALKALDKYGFSTVLCVNNFYKDSKSMLIEHFDNLIQTLQLNNITIQIADWISTNTISNQTDYNGIYDCDCKHGRLLSQNGIFTCPFLANDYRGRQGNNFKDYSTSVRLETPFCSSCMANREPFNMINIS